jgi:hypothetical protein
MRQAVQYCLDQPAVLSGGGDKSEPQKVSIHLGSVPGKVTVATMRRIMSSMGNAQEGILCTELDWRAKNAGTPAPMYGTNICHHNIDGKVGFELPVMEAWFSDW